MAEILAVESLCGGGGVVGSRPLLGHSHVMLGCDNIENIVWAHNPKPSILSHRFAALDNNLVLINFTFIQEQFLMGFLYEIILVITYCY